MMFCSVHGSCVTCSSSSTTTRVSLFFLKSKRVILGLREVENDIDVMQKACARTQTHTQKKKTEKILAIAVLPKEQADLGLALKHEHSSGGQSQAVLIAVSGLEVE